MRQLDRRHAAYLARKAREFNPDNAVARQSHEALLAKGIQEAGGESGCLESLLAGRNLKKELELRGYLLS